MLEKPTEPLIVVITGASGSGKTTVAKLLEQKFSKETTSLYYFDDIGIPSTTKIIEPWLGRKMAAMGNRKLDRTYP
jgi:uridine kinase